MCEVSFGRLRVVAGTVTDSTARRSHHKVPAVEFVSRSVPVFSCFICQLIESREDIICELHFSNHICSCLSHSNCESSDSLFTKRSIEHSICSILLVQVHSASENSSKFDIFSKTDCRIILRHCHIESVIDSCTKVHILGLTWVLQLKFLCISLLREIKDKRIVLRSESSLC